MDDKTLAAKTADHLVHMRRFAKVHRDNMPAHLAEILIEAERHEIWKRTVGAGVADRYPSPYDPKEGEA